MHIKLSYSMELHTSLIEPNTSDWNSSIISLNSSYPGSYQQNCQCNNQLTFQDKYGRIHGACRRADETGRRWCYTTGGYCSDARQSQRYPNNPWSYQACSYSG